MQRYRGVWSDETKIVTAGDVATYAGVPSVENFIRTMAARRGLRIDMEADKAHPVYAEIDHGRWLAVCDVCGGAEYVDPQEPIFFCQACGNARFEGRVRHVVFPRARRRIERELLKKPVNERQWRREVKK